MISWVYNSKNIDSNALAFSKKVSGLHVGRGYFCFGSSYEVRKNLEIGRSFPFC